MVLVGCSRSRVDADTMVVGALVPGVLDAGVVEVGVEELGEVDELD